MTNIVSDNSKALITNDHCFYVEAVNIFNDPFAEKEPFRGCGDFGRDYTVKEQPMVSNHYMSQVGCRDTVPAASRAPLGGIDARCE